MKIYGLGVDIVETARIKSSIERFGDRFIQRIFLPDEVAYAQSMKSPELHLAARFAAKEAISKAFLTGIGSTFGWKDLEVRRRESGAPYVVLHGRARAYAESKGVIDVLVSLSHTAAYGAATAVVMVDETAP